MLTPFFFFPSDDFFLVRTRVSGSSWDCCRLPLPPAPTTPPPPPLLLLSLKRVVAAAALLLAQLQMASKIRTTNPRARFTTLPFLKSGMAKPERLVHHAKSKKYKKTETKVNEKAKDKLGATKYGHAIELAYKLGWKFYYLLEVLLQMTSVISPPPIKKLFKLLVWLIVEPSTFFMFFTLWSYLSWHIYMNFYKLEIQRKESSTSS